MSGTTVEAPARSETARRIAALRTPKWYQNARWTRLGGLLFAGIVLTLMFGEQGSVDDVFFALKQLYEDPLPTLTWLVLMTAVWAFMEFGAPLRERARPALEAVGARQKQAGSAVRSGVARPAVKWPLLAAGALVLVLLPEFLATYWQQILVGEIAIYVLLAVGLNVVVGWAGLLDLGFIAFFAVGAYSSAYWTGSLPVDPPVKLTPFLVIPVAMLTCLLAGLLLGAPTLRLRGDYLAIVTLGFHEIIYLVAKNREDFTNGPRGVIGVPPFKLDLGFWSYTWGDSGLSPKQYWWLILVLGGLLIFLFRRLEHSRVGRAWTAIREDEVAAAANGVNTVKYKLMAFAIGASTSGIAGVVYASKIGSFSPESFILMYSVLVLAYVIFGGMGSLWGVILGTAFLAWLPQFLKDYVDPKDRFMYLGALLVIMMIYRPQGLIPSRRRKRELIMAKEGIGDADAMSEPVGGRIA
ncbi:branched-chain amino acid ABC transporter permease [Uniformispora flossi]|uniref:branched-chain amino acid ABC transporter permease n=1 Tax=Uniformispora flossi TaxID=3390723 RepID=UPI003C2D6026